MTKLFSYDNPIWKCMGRVADFFFLTVLWIMFSLPVITIGASTTALYYVTLKMAKNNECYIHSSFVKAFKDNFRQSTVIWMVMLTAGVFLGSDVYFFYHMGSRLGIVIFWLMFVLVVLFMLMLTLIFPLTARLDTNVTNLFFMTFMVSMKHFSWVSLMVVMSMCIISVGIFVFWPVLLLAVGGIAFLHSKVLVFMIFPKYNWNSEEER